MKTTFLAQTVAGFFAKLTVVTRKYRGRTFISLFENGQLKRQYGRARADEAAFHEKLRAGLTALWGKVLLPEESTPIGTQQARQRINLN